MNILEGIVGTKPPVNHVHPTDPVIASPPFIKTNSGLNGNRMSHSAFPDSKGLNRPNSNYQ